jgi:cytosine permease
VTSSEHKPGIFERLDELNEFERQPVSEDQLKGGRYFAGAFSGEHIAATEFVIGVLFVNFGARTFDVIVGLLLGNLLAVLSWTLVCAPIAVRTRLTLYWYLRNIVGRPMMVLYNVLNAVLYCILGGAMITVSASAVRIPFGIPEQTHWLPHDWRFVVLVLAIGSVVVTMSILGFRRLAQFSMVCSPWMLLMFIAGFFAMLPVLGHIRSFGDFWRVADASIWNGGASSTNHSLGFWHMVFFAWICNLGMHIGLTDMAMFRYAKNSWYGFYSAFGMYLGHYIAWIAAGVMGAAVASMLKRPLAEIDAGTVGYNALGISGALAVVFAGWTTANPMLYRAGLAFQVITPGWPRWFVTLLAGIITTLTACSPFIFTRALDFLGLYGLLLMPVGTIVVLEHWFFPRLGLKQYWTVRKGLFTNWPALIAWLGGLGLGFFGLWLGLIPHFFFLFIPVWFLTAAIYLPLEALGGPRESLPELRAAATLIAADPPPAAMRPPTVAPSKGNNIIYHVSGIVAVVSLVLCILVPLWVFLSTPETVMARLETAKTWLLGATVVYFISGTIWLMDYEHRKEIAAR